MRLRQRILVFAGVCLPVPVFAATGLSVPLPSTVERMAAELVPFADPVTLAEAEVRARGSIVLTRGERRRVRQVTPPRSAAAGERAQAPLRQLEQHRGEVQAERSPELPARNEIAPGRSGPRVQPDPHPSPPQPVSSPAEDRPAPGGERPKPPPHPKPPPGPRPRPDEEPKTKPKPHEPEPKPKPTPELPPKPRPEPEPKSEPEGQPAPMPPPEPATSAGEAGARPEKDKGAAAGKPFRTTSVVQS